MAQDEEVPIPMIQYNIKHEVGVMAGFMGVMIISAITFLILWRSYNKREEKKEAEWKAGLVEAGFGELEKKHGKRKEERADVQNAETEKELSVGGDGSGERIVTKA